MSSSNTKQLSFSPAPVPSSGRAAHVDVPESFTSRTIDQRIEAKDQVEGKGARVRRSIGTRQLRNFDPFLLVDEFSVSAGTGFPDHPHRGLETVTYMFPTTSGALEHEDFAGHRGVITAGDLQWMNAGRGIVHCEMSASKEVAHGLQLWVNLAAKDKMVEPTYQGLKAHDIPHVESQGVKAIVIAGEALGITSPIYTRSPTHYVHFIMQPNSTLKQPIPVGWNSFLYMMSGRAYVGGSTDSSAEVRAHHAVTLQVDGDGVTVTTKDEPVEFAYLAGKPNNEPIQRRGLFVMNTNDELTTAFRDFEHSINGFERAVGWKSEIGTRAQEK